MAEEPTGDDDKGDGSVEELKAADAKEVHRAVREEGEAELERPWTSLVWSAMAAGFAINASLIGEGAIHAMTEQSPYRILLVSLAYPIGFVIVVLGRMQFFTESTITAMLPLVSKPSAWAARRTLRLWAIVLGFNVLATLIVTGALIHLPMVDAPVRDGIVAVSGKLLERDMFATFCTAIPAGFMVAGIAWLLPNAREQAFLVIYAITYVVGMAGFSHSVVGSAEAWVLAWTGAIGWPGAVVRLILPAVLGNLVGGAGLFAVLAHGQVRDEMKEG